MRAAALHPSVPDRGAEDGLDVLLPLPARRDARRHPDGFRFPAEGHQDPSPLEVNPFTAEDMPGGNSASRSIWAQ